MFGKDFKNCFKDLELVVGSLDIFVFTVILLKLNLESEFKWIVNTNKTLLDVFFVLVYSAGVTERVTILQR